jgi:hypothetical protein
MPPHAPDGLKQLYDYWRSLAGGAAPERALIDPAMIKAILPFMYIVVFEDDPFRVRYILTGTRADEWNGFNMTGRYVDEFLKSDLNGSNAHLLACYRQCWETGQPCFSKYLWPTRSGYQIKVNFALLPLKVDGAIRQCLAIEDYSDLPENADWLPFENV